MIHVIPLNDLKKHEESTTCKCKPKVEILENGEIMIIHKILAQETHWLQSADGRNAPAFALPKLNKFKIIF